MRFGLTQKPAWFFLHRIRLTMQAEWFAKMTGEIELDKNVHRRQSPQHALQKRKRMGITQGKSMAGKVA